MVADPADAIDAALDHRLLADEHAVADLERLRMTKHDRSADAQAVAARARHRAQHDPAHQGVELGLALNEAAVECRQPTRVVLLPQVIGELALEWRVGLHRPAAVHGGDRTSEVAHRAATSPLVRGRPSRKWPSVSAMSSAYAHATTAARRSAAARGGTAADTVSARMLQRRPPPRPPGHR
jgi:hypothetical protein